MLTQLKSIVGILLVTVSLGMTGCSSSAVYTVPSYYQSQMIPKHYRVGKTYYVSDLKCHSTKENCSTAIKSEEGSSHRKYPQSSLF